MPAWICATAGVLVLIALAFMWAMVRVAAMDDAAMDRWLEERIEDDAA